MQAYLKEFPNGQFVAEVKTRLPQIENLAARETAQSTVPQAPAQPQPAIASGGVVVVPAAK
jgi:hypothetical protein